LGLLLADIAINLCKFSECKEPSSFKDFVDTATTSSVARAAAFMAFLALALFVLCLTTIMLLAEEYKSYFSCTEEDKGNHPLLNQFSIPVAALAMPPVAVALTFMEGGDLTGALHFNQAFMNHLYMDYYPSYYKKSMRQYPLQNLAISSISSFYKFCWVQEHYVLSDKRSFKI
jgi:hypothetical protein